MGSAPGYSKRTGISYNYLRKNPNFERDFSLVKGTIPYLEN